jgi:hypothetical protein
MKYAISLFFLFSFTFFSCAADLDVQEVFGHNAETPVFLGCKALDGRTISFDFSIPVKVASLVFSDGSTVAGIKEGATVTASLAEALPAGARVSADILVKDKNGSSLNVLTNFRARNDQMPRIIISEVRANKSFSASAKAPVARAEFVEFLPLEAGNLGGLRLFVTSPAKNGKLVYEFPPVEVKQGDYIVVHLQDKAGNGVDETGERLNLSPETGQLADSGGTIKTWTTEASSGARDLWIPASRKNHSSYYSSKKPGVIYFMDQDEEVLDALVFHAAEGDWDNDAVRDAAALLAGKGAWKSGLAADAFRADRQSPTQTICRKTGPGNSLIDSNSAADWYIASKASPGSSNAGPKAASKRKQP